MKMREIFLSAVAAICAVSVGLNTVWAVGTPAYTVGHYGNGRLGGSGTVTDQWLPIPVVGITNGIDIAVGDAHTLVARADGTVWGWGGNGNGQLGIGNTTEQWLASPATGLTNAVAVAAGHAHSLAVKSDGTVWSWGYNGHGQLGNGNTGTGRTTPVQVSSLNTAIAVAAGYHSLALLSNGTVWAWGYNGQGQLGNGNQTNQNTPVQVLGLSGATAIAAARPSSDNHSLALKSDGTVWAWGYNGYGQLGNNSTTDRSTPVQVSGLTNAVAIASGHYHSLAVRGDGTVWTWGRNDNAGQLGDGTMLNRSTPVQVLGLTNAVAVGAGDSHSFAISADGTAWGWGNNANGILGDGTPVNRLTAVRVAGILASAVTGGQYHSAFLHAYDCNDPNPDCNGNGTHDGCDLLTGFSPDCNTNGVPDECDAGTTSIDCDGNIIPDECDNQSGNINWTGGNGGNYGLSSNWSPAGPPRGLSQAYFSQSGASDNRSIVSGDIGACSVVIQASGSGKQILQVNDGTSYFTGNGITINAGGELDLRGGTVSGGPILNQSNTIVGYGTIDANLINSGSISVANLSDMHFTGGAFDNQASGDILAAAGSRVRVTSPDVTQAGNIEIRSSAIFYTVEPLTNSAGGTIAIYGGTLNSDSITNALGGTIDGFGVIDGDLTNDGIVVTRADSQVVGDLDNDGTVFNLSGFFTVLGNITGDGSIIGQPGGRAPGSGFAVSGDVSMAGAAQLSVPDGTLRIAGDADLRIADPARFDMTTATLHVNGLPADGPQMLAALAPDYGRRVSLSDPALYPIHRLRIGPAATTVRLVADQWAGAEALYVNELVLDPGVTLDLAGGRLYYQRLIPSGNPPAELGGRDFVLSNGAIIRDSFGDGLFCRIGSLRGDGDINGDCRLNSVDVPGLISVLLNIDTDPASRASADMDANGLNDARDITAFVNGLLGGN